MVRLDGYDDRRPTQLSGGQRQRVALARALVNRPKVLLFDEPLGALDLKLREEMQVELKAIQREVGITFVFVTHDQGEALSMSNRLAVFNEGRIEQVGAPAEIYEHPATEFVAGFVGTSNIVERDGRRSRSGGRRCGSSKARARQGGCTWRRADPRRAYAGMITRSWWNWTGAGSCRSSAEPRDVLAGGARAAGKARASRLAPASTRTPSRRLATRRREP